MVVEPTASTVMSTPSVTVFCIDMAPSTPFAMSDTFAGHHSLGLQQTMFEMGAQMIASQPGINEVRFSLPNKHHFVIDLSPFGLDNPNEVFHADDRPYGLIEGTIRRDDAPEPGLAFDPGQGW